LFCGWGFVSCSRCGGGGGGGEGSSTLGNGYTTWDYRNHGMMHN